MYVYVYIYIYTHTHIYLFMFAYLYERAWAHTSICVRAVASLHDSAGRRGSVKPARAHSSVVRRGEAFD